MKTFTLAPAAAAAHIAALCQLSGSGAAGEGAAGAGCQQVLSAAEELLGTYVEGKAAVKGSAGQQGWDANLKAATALQSVGEVGVRLSGRPLLLEGGCPAASGQPLP